MKIVFDFDGTLLDSSKRHIQVLQDCLNQKGYNRYSLKGYLEYKADGYSTAAFLKEKLGFSNWQSEEVSRMWISHIEDLDYLRTDQLYYDAIPTLYACLEHADILYLCSARQKEQHLMYQINQLELSNVFCEVFCASPATAVDEKEYFINRVQPDLVVGDSEVDFSAAKRSGVRSYILNRGFRSKAYWDKHKVKTYHSLDGLRY
ncbi:HAD family hydrolase [Enterocloster citroniae]|uniref:Phosphoglycolate phosphatase-like HAD superfamily hydrolase n=2 Tax=Enterocloster citroniae TaxID=358743 RepID=A0ABV2FXF1_9FIRM|nr:HAD hydrolase-like protein [Enterocloster citroniae]KMW24248.1 hypothetical protein HMPREF9470_00110 [[Clostridium] citroniae WAL-19142]